MDTPNDNPLKRFGAAFWGLVIALVFGVATLIAGIIVNLQKDDPIADALAEQRRETRKAIDQAQAAAMKVDPATVYQAVGKELTTGAPAPLKDNAQVVPGSPTWEKIQNAETEVVVVEELPADTPIDPAVMEMGKAQFALCMACHGPNGEGLPQLGPPLAGSEWVLGPVTNLIRIQLRGLTGPITVKGTEYAPAAPMAPMSYQTDEQVAAVLTYVRNSFGNQAPPVSPEQVKALRGEVGKEMLTVDDLISPHAAN